MTPRQIAERILDEVLREQIPSDGMIAFVEAIVGETINRARIGGKREGISIKYNREIWEKRIREAVAEERESCAKVAETEGPCTGKWDAYEKGWSKAAYAIANKIRARGKK